MTWLCSCMMFLHVARMREAGWIGGNPWLASQITNKSNWGISTLGDQAMFNWVRKTSPHLHGKPIDSKWVASNCESFGFRGSRGSQPKSPPGMLPESGRQPWTARHFNCFGPKDYASGNGKIFVYYTTLAKQKDVNVCDHRFTSVDTSQPAVNSATLVSTLPGSQAAAAELKVTSTIMSTVGVSKECLAWDCTCQGFSDTFDTWPWHWGTAKNQPSAVKAWWMDHKCETKPARSA